MRVENGGRWGGRREGIADGRCLVQGSDRGRQMACKTSQSSATQHAEEGREESRCCDKRKNLAGGGNFARTHIVYKGSKRVEIKDGNRKLYTPSLSLSHTL